MAPRFTPEWLDHVIKSAYSHWSGNSIPRSARSPVRTGHQPQAPKLAIARACPCRWIVAGASGTSGEAFSDR
jgi:hypothetical protein